MRLLATLMESIPDACRLKVLRMRLAAEHLAHFSSRIKSAWNKVKEVWHPEARLLRMRRG